MITRRRRVRSALVSTGVAAMVAGVLGAPAVAGAAAPTQVGWWHQAQQLPIGLPAPPNVPPGGLFVANTPGGPGAVSAVRFASAAPSAGALKLKINANSAPMASIGAINACVLLADWKATQNGPWSEAPPYSCAVSAKAKLESDGVTLDWEIPEVFQNEDLDYVDVMLVADPAANPFEIAFDPPGQDAFIQQDSEAPAFVPPPEPEPSFDPAFDTSGAFVPGPAAPGFSFGSDVTSSPVPVAAPVPQTRPRTAAPLARPAPAAAYRDRRQRLEATLLLFVLAATWFWLAGEPVRAPRLLGTIGGSASRRARPATADPVRGIGRFTRPRSGRPPKLS